MTLPSLMVCHYLFPSYLKTTAFKLKEECSFFNLLAYSSCSSNSMAHVERPFYPKHMEPHGQARGPQQPYLTTPMGADTIQYATIKASSGHPPASEIRRSKVRIRRKVCIWSYAFLHGQGRACTPKCPGISARRRGLLRRRMKSEETLLPAGKSPPKATLNPLTFSWDSDEM